MSKFGIDVRFYEKGAPYPGFCLRCSVTDNLYDLGMIRGTNMGAYLCKNCLAEVALFDGFIRGERYAEEVAALTNQINDLKAQLSAVPNLLKEFQNEYTDLVTEFVTSVAAVSAPSEPVQPKSAKAGTGGAEPDSHPSDHSRSAKAQPLNTSPKSSK